MEPEIWKDIVWYEWLYQISNTWKVKSFHRWLIKVIKWIVNTYWYYNLILSKSWFTRWLKLHRIVAQAFIPNPENKPCVNHINWVKTDNRIENLEWCTYSENNLHAYRTWLKTVTDNHIFKTNNPHLWKRWHKSRLARRVYQISMQWDILREWLSIIEAAEELNICESNITMCCKWQYKQARGFKWKYVNENYSH